MIKHKKVFTIYILLIFILCNHTLTYAGGKIILKCKDPKDTALDKIVNKHDTVFIIYPDKQLAEIVSEYPKRVGKVEIKEYAFILTFPKTQKSEYWLPEKRDYMKGYIIIQRYTGYMQKYWGEAKNPNNQYSSGFCEVGERLF